MQFLKVMPGARGTAMGDSYSVWATGVDALFWNPGGLPLMENSEMTFSYTNWIFDTQQGAIGFATSLGSLGAVGVQFQYVDFGNSWKQARLSHSSRIPSIRVRRGIHSVHSATSSAQATVQGSRTSSLQV